MAKKLPQNDLISYVKRALEEQGYIHCKAPGFPKRRVWLIEKGGERQSAIIRTSNNRWLALNRKENRWKTLDEANPEFVIVASVDDKELPRNIDIFMFPAEKVRQRFEARLKAQSKNGMDNDFPIWIALDQQAGGKTTALGSGLADEFPPIATMPIDKRGNTSQTTQQHATRSINQAGMTIAEAIETARQQIAEISGKPAHKVSLELKIV